MTRTFAAALATTAFLAGLPAAAAEHRLVVDLGGLDLTSASGAAVAAARMARAVDDYCGPADMPQPLTLSRERATCRVAMQARAQDTLASAKARADSAAAPIEQARATPDPAHMLP
jgi:UrcA family protein